MSTRALRKLQKQRELQELEQSDAASDSDQGSAPAARPSAFALLGDQQEDEDDEDDDDDGSGAQGEPPEDSAGQSDVEHKDHGEPRQDGTSSGKSSRRKKNKKKNKKGSSQSDAKPTDDIDAALAALNVRDAAGDAAGQTKTASQEILHMCELLSVDGQHLQVSNEMRRLFGRAAFDADRAEAADHAARRTQSGEDNGYGIAEATRGRNAYGGAGISQVILKRNLFVKGKEDWPKATSNGLSMEVVQELPGGITEYTFRHNKEYQSAQREFDACVLSMDPVLLVRLLLYYPYNVSTLLQVSEISKHEKDYSTSGELLERALFSFGRALHSTFAATVAKGKARLDFRRPENREFFLAGWRYILNISMRATWRTAYEWAKLLLSLSPEDDPYCMRFVLDQLALRAKQGAPFLSLSRSAFFSTRWAHLPNIAFSAALADRSSSALVKVVETYPWVAARLLSALDVSKLPPAVWGKTAPEDDALANLQSELYVSQGLDLWKAPDAKDLLVAACAQAKAENAASTSSDSDRPISLDEARHVLLLDKPPLIALLPHEITRQVGSTSDPLPPADSITSYTTDVAAATRHRQSGLSTDIDQALTSVPAIQLMDENPRAYIEELGVLQKFFEILELESRSNFTMAGDSTFTPLISESTPVDHPTDTTPGAFPADADTDTDVDTDGDANADVGTQRDSAQRNPGQPTELWSNIVRQSGATLSELRARLQRYAELKLVLYAQPGHTLRTDEGDFAIFHDDERLECHLEGMEIVGELRAEGDERGSQMTRYADIRRRATEVNDAQDVD